MKRGAFIPDNLILMQPKRKIFFFSLFSKSQLSLFICLEILTRLSATMRSLFKIEAPLCLKACLSSAEIVLLCL